MDLVLVFCRSSFPSNIYWKGCLYRIFWALCQNHSYVCSYLGLLFWSIGLHICFCVSTMLFLLPCLCSIIWSQVLWSSSIILFAQHCLGYSMSFVLPYELWGWFLNLCDECHWDFDGDCIWWSSHFHNIDSASPWASGIFPFSVIFFDLFLQWGSFHCRGLSLPLLSLLLGILFFWGYF
jgi:hypothetical protein